MEHKISENKLIEIYCFVDECVKILNEYYAENLAEHYYVYKSGLSMSEMITIQILYHLSGYKTFEYFYNSLNYNYLHNYFPNIPNIKSFYERQKKTSVYLVGVLLMKISLSKKNGIFYIDSTKIEVCKASRMSRNKVFLNYAKKSKTSTGWFFGFKLHLVINELGEIVSYRITTGDVADNNLQLLQQLLSGLKGKCFGDKGYISSLFSSFYENGLKIVTGLRANMKNQIIDLNEAKLLKKRGLIEAVNDILKSVCDLEHSRHRSVENAIQSMHCAVIAYSFLDNKPELILKNFLCAA